MSALAETSIVASLGASANDAGTSASLLLRRMSVSRRAASDPDPNPRGTRPNLFPDASKRSMLGGRPDSGSATSLFFETSTTRALAQRRHSSGISARAFSLASSVSSSVNAPISGHNSTRRFFRRRSVLSAVSLPISSGARPRSASSGSAERSSSTTRPSSRVDTPRHDAGSANSTHRSARAGTATRSARSASASVTIGARIVTFGLHIACFAPRRSRSRANSAGSDAIGFTRRSSRSSFGDAASDDGAASILFPERSTSRIEPTRRRNDGTTRSAHALASRRSSRARFPYDDGNLEIGFPEKSTRSSDAHSPRRSGGFAILARDASSSASVVATSPMDSGISASFGFPDTSSEVNAGTLVPKSAGSDVNAFFANASRRSDERRHIARGPDPRTPHEVNSSVSSAHPAR